MTNRSVAAESLINGKIEHYLTAPAPWGVPRPLPAPLFVLHSFTGGGGGGGAPPPEPALINEPGLVHIKI